MRILNIIFIFLSVITVSSAQKIVIHFDSTPSPTPSVSKAIFKFNKDFAYSFTLDDATEDAFTCALPVFSGGEIAAINTNFTGLFQTDGCGNDVPFRAGVAWNTANIYGENIHNGDVQGQLTWTQLDVLIDKGWDVFNHSYSHKAKSTNAMTRADYVSEIEQNSLVVKQKTNRKIELNTFVVPSGDNVYQDIALDMGYKIVFDQNIGVTGIGGVVVDDDFGLDRLKLHRQLLEESISSLNRLDDVVKKSQNGQRIWYNEFTHHIDNFQNANFNFYTFYSYMKNVAESHGKTGSDRMWFAPLQEVYEYLLARKHITYTATLKGKDLAIDFNQNNVPKWLRRNVLTLVVDSETPFSKVEVPNGVKVTFKGSGNRKIINLDFEEYIATGSQELTPSVFRLFPSPASDTLILDLEKEMGEMDFIIQYFTGKRYLAGKIKEKRNILNVQTLPLGAYIISLKKGNQFYSQKFVKV